MGFSNIFCEEFGAEADPENRCTLPSRTKPKNFFNVHYHRALTFEVQPPGRKLLRQANIERKVIVLPGSIPKLIGLAQHCVSIYRIHLGSHWIGLILVDPPIKDTYFYNDGGRALIEVKLRTHLYLGGYEDFLDQPLPSKEEMLGPPQRGLLEDLSYYWTSLPPHFNNTSASLMSLSYYPLRIVAAEWVKYIAVMQTSIKQYEYSGKELPNFLDELQKLHSNLRTLQSWRRRIMSTQQKIKAASRLLKNWQDMDEPLESKIVAPVLEDYKFIADNIDESGRRLENMLPVVTSLVQIVDSQRSFAETENITRLTILALVFVPMTFISSIFSMNAENGPGGRYFWVYFAVSLPMTAVVLVVASSPMRKSKKIWNRFQNQMVSRHKAERPRNLTKSLAKSELGVFELP